MSEDLLFSIVVPVYRVEEYLPVCVDSLRSQTYSNLEIILVDDGSPDSCPELCDDYARQDSRIRVIHKENAGPTAARKTGAAAATGAYICCVDSDDYVAPDYIEKLAGPILAGGADIVCCGAYTEMPGKSKATPVRCRMGHYSRADLEKEIFPQLIQTAGASYFTPTFWAKAIRADIFKRQIQRVDDRIKIGEDSACIIPCVFEANSMEVLPQCLYYYRYNPISLTKSRKAFRWDGPKRIAEHLRRYVDLEQFDFREQWYRKTVHELFTVVSSQFNREEPYSTVVKDILLHLQEPVYREAIEKCRFEGRSGRLAHFALKYHAFRLIWLFQWLKKL